MRELMVRENAGGTDEQQGGNEAADGMPVREEDVSAVEEFANPT